MKYGNFDLWIDSKREDSYPLRAASHRGEVRDLLTLDPDDLTAIVGDLDKLVQRDTDRDFLIHFGSGLYKHLFVGKIESLFEGSHGEVKNNEKIALRIRLRTEDAEIAALPWEFLYSTTQERFLGTSIYTPLMRYQELFQPIGSLETEVPLRMLVIIPNSVDPYPELNAETEKTNLLQALKGLENSIQVKFLDGNVTYDRIGDELLEESYHCLHYIGHGDFQEDKGYLLLNSEDGTCDFVDDQQFASLFQDYDAMKLVVLNACKGAQVSYSKPLVGMAPQLVKRGIPAVVAMQYAISDEAAILFAREFYRSLFKGKYKGRVEAAMSHARNRLVGKLPDDRDVGNPVLFMRAWDGVLFDIVTGNFVEDMPLSREKYDTARDVQKTHERNISILEERLKESRNSETEKKLQQEQEQRKRLEQRIKFRNYTLAAAFGVIMLVFLLSLVNFFDFFALDTKIESSIIRLGDLLTENTFSDQIALVSINEQTESILDKSFDKSWRHEHALLVENLSQAGAKVIVFDMYFPKESQFDQEFSNAIYEAKKSGTAVIVGIGDIEKGEPALVEELKNAVTGFGVLCLGAKLNDRRIDPWIIEEKSGYSFHSLTYEVIDAYQGVINFDMNPVARIGGVSCRTAIRQNDRVYGFFIELTPLEKLRKSPQRYAYEEVIKAGPDKLEQFKDKIVVVGVEKQTYKVYRGWKEEHRYGLELYADAINSVLNRRAIYPLKRENELLIIICLGLLGAFTRYRMAQARWYWRIGISSIILIVYLTNIMYVYIQHHVLLNVMYHIVAFCFTYWVTGKIERRFFS